MVEEQGCESKSHAKQHRYDFLSAEFMVFGTAFIQYGGGNMEERPDHQWYDIHQEVGNKMEFLSVIHGQCCRNG